MDLLRAVMTGPSDTPYADILFLFDIYLPPNYPEVPPKVNMNMNMNMKMNMNTCTHFLPHLPST